MRHLRLVLDDVGRHPGPGDFTRGWYELLRSETKAYVLGGNLLDPLDDLTNCG